MTLQWTSIGLGQAHTLKQGHLYRWRAVVSLPCDQVRAATFQVAQQLAAAGLQNAFMTTEPEKLKGVQPTWPTNKRDAPTAPGLGQCVVFAEARWSLPDQPFDPSIVNTPGVAPIDLWDQTDGVALIGEPPVVAGDRPADTTEPPADTTDPPDDTTEPPHDSGDEDPSTTKAPKKKKSFLPAIIAGTGLLILAGIVVVSGSSRPPSDADSPSR